MADCAEKVPDFYRIFAENSSNWECWHEPDARLIYVSPSSEQITGYTPQDFYSTKDLLVQIVHPQDRQKFETHCSASVEGPQVVGTPEELQFRITRKDGRICWLSHLCRPVYDSQGHLLGRRSTNHDITRQKQLEEELKTLAQFPHQNPDPVMRLTPQAQVVYMNPASLALFGPLGLTVGQMVPEPFKSAVLNAACTRQTVHQTVECGSRQFWLTFAVVEGGVHAYGRDFTDHKRTEERLRLISETANRFLVTEDPQAVIKDLCKSVMLFLQCDCFFNYLADESCGRLHLNACAGIPDAAVGQVEWLDYGTAVCGYVAKTGQRLIVENVQHSDDARVQLLQSLGIGAYACHPMKGPEGTLIGTLAFGTRGRDAFGEQDLSLMNTVADLTAATMFRMQIERTLRNSRQDLQRAQEVAHIGSWRLKLPDNILTWSDETYRIFGIPVATPMTFQRFLAAVHPDDKAMVEEIWNTALKGKNYRCEHRIMADKAVKWVREKAELEFDADGKLISVFGTVQDITRQRKEALELLAAQHALNDSNQMLQSVLDNTHVLVACMDRNFNFLRVNTAYARADDREVDFFPGKNHFDLYPDEENNAIFKQVVETGEPCIVFARKFEYAHNPERGPSYWDWSLVPIKDESGNVSRLVLTLADVTQQKRSQDAHEHRMKRNETLVRASEDILRADNNDSLVNTIACTARILTQSSFAVTESIGDKNVASSMACFAADAMQQHIWNQYFAAFKQRLYAEISKHGQCLRLTQEQLRSHRILKDLPANHVNVNGLIALPLVNAKAKVNGLILVTHKEQGTFSDEDEAELKQLAAISSLALQHLEARQQLTRERDMLDHRVRQRTDDLERTVKTLGEEVLQRVQVEADLQATNAELQRRAERLSQMASELTIAEHRERSRLAEVLHDGLQQILVAAKLELSIIAGKMSRAHRQAVDHVVDLLRDSIHASRTLTVELYPPVLRESGILGGIEWLIRWMSEHYGFKVELEKSGEVNVQREDMCILLFQSIRELLFNTVKHSQVKQAKLQIRRKGDFVELTIRDEGKGFDPEKASDSQETGGFGLFSIRERLRSMGGKLEIISAPGAGSTFILTVPADVTVKPEELVSVSKRKIETICPLPQPASAKLEAIRILVVDDHTIMRRGLATLLRQEPDMKVVGEAATGEEAIQLALHLKPNVILMDFSLPGINGAETTRRICSELESVRVIGLSMFDEQDRAMAMFEAGASAYATKSESPAILLTAIRSVASLARNLNPMQEGESLHPNA